MNVPFQGLDLSALSPVEKIELADMLYDTAQQELESKTLPLTDEQWREINRRIAAADAGKLTGEPWKVLLARLQNH